MAGDPFLDDALRQLRKYKALADDALAQIEPAQWTERPDAESNPIALIVKHVAGNQRSRWTDFLTTDGEKPDRDRDGEFELAATDTPASLRERWERGWALCLATLEPLRASDLQRVVTVRGEPHTVMQAIQRQLTHYAYHVGQIVYLARHLAGARWRSLSIPKGRSREFEVSKDGRPYGASPGGASA